MIKKKKILFFVYCLLVSALSIGWRIPGGRHWLVSTESE